MLKMKLDESRVIGTASVSTSVSYTFFKEHQSFLKILINSSCVVFEVSLLG